MLRNIIDSIRARWHGLRCRPGDLCLVRRDATGTHQPTGKRYTLRGGTVVRVTNLFVLDGDPAWWFEEPIRLEPGITADGVIDELLTPLRDRPGEDEILRIAGKPVEKPAAPVVGKPAEVA